MRKDFYLILIDKIANKFSLELYDINKFTFGISHTETVLIEDIIYNAEICNECKDNNDSTQNIIKNFKKFSFNEEIKVYKYQKYLLYMYNFNEDRLGLCYKFSTGSSCSIDVKCCPSCFRIIHAHSIVGGCVDIVSYCLENDIEHDLAIYLLYSMFYYRKEDITALAESYFPEIPISLLCY